MGSAVIATTSLPSLFAAIIPPALEDVHAMPWHLWRALSKTRPKPLVAASSDTLCVAFAAQSPIAIWLVSQNRGTPIWTPKYYRPPYRDPQKGSARFWETPAQKQLEAKPTRHTHPYRGEDLTGARAGGQDLLLKKAPFKQANLMSGARSTAHGHWQMGPECFGLKSI